MEARIIGRAAAAAAPLDLSEDDEDLAPAPDAAPSRRVVVPADLDGVRLDKALATMLPAVSRSRLQQWIDAGAVRIDGRVPRPREAVHARAAIDVQLVPAPEQAAFAPERMPLAIVHEDDAVLVLDKPPGLVVHPGAGNWSGTLLNGLLAHDAGLARLPRAGIVHRLDADTSGLMVVARTLAAHTDLVRQLQARSVTREYWAVVHGRVDAGGTIDAPLARDPRNPLRFRVSRAARAREARTHWRRIADAPLAPCAWIACRLDTGRTHQIRVHLESIGHPLVGDRVYRRGAPAEAPPAAAGFGRQALHACRLAFVHPATGASMTWFRAPPADMRALMRALGLRNTTRPRAAFD